jgi:predicted phage terminase large subunit-like protein
MVAVQEAPANTINITPQDGPQKAFMSTTADVAGYGGAAGGGKTWCCLAEPLRFLPLGLFGAVIFRRSMPEVMAEGGLWDEARQMYAPIGADPKPSSHTITFPSGMRVRFAHLQYEDTVYNWQGSQIPLLIFDELTHFTEFQFFYMLSRLRSMSGVAAYVRATCNPDAESWVKKFFAPWLDKKYADPAESGEIRYFFRVKGAIFWHRTREEAFAHAQELDESITLNDVRSGTFIKSRVTDNPKMLENNPGYIGWLKSLPPVERARLLDGDWDVLPDASKVFDRTWFQVVDRADIPDQAPSVYDNWGKLLESGRGMLEVRYWDFAATERKMKGKQPDYTAGVKIRLVGRRIYIMDVVRIQAGPAEVDELVLRTAMADGRNCMIRWEEEGGASGKRDSSHLINLLAGFDAQPATFPGDKVQRAKPLATQARPPVSNVFVRYADWNDEFLAEMHHFPDWANDDQVDGASGGYLSALEGSGAVGMSEDPFDF